MALIAVNGINLNVQVKGQGLPIVMLHGFTGDMSTWYPMANILAEQYATVLVDLIGHGRSGAPEDPERYSMERCVEDLLELTDRLGIGEAVWMGYSMGGRVCLCVGMTAPEKCRALVLEGASGGIEDDVNRRARASRDEALARRIEEKGVEWFVDYWESQPLFVSQGRLDEATRLGLRCQRLKNRATGLANSLRGMGAGVQPQVYARLKEFPKRALFLAGEKDGKFVDLGWRMSGLVPKGEFEAIRNAGHCAHLENPDQFCEKVSGFLNSLQCGLQPNASPGPEGEALYSLGVRGNAQTGGTGSWEEAVGRGEGSLEEVVAE